VVLTAHELTAVSSAVAALAVLGGYLGVRSANRNALRIAREERSSARRDELDSLKRTTYAKFLTALMTLVSASLELEAVIKDEIVQGGPRINVIKKREEALAEVRSIAAELEFYASDPLYKLANKTMETADACKRESEQIFTLEAARLRAAMRCDLQGSPIPDLGELDRLAHRSIAALPPNSQYECSAEPQSAVNEAAGSDASTSLG
jgi:metal-dependent amidase/aminoacylase/carboxypeptidase family protein